MPSERSGPLPVIFYGHGLNSKRWEGRELAKRFVPEGWIVIAADAMFHNEHPTNNGGDLAALDFLGLDLDAFSLDALALRGNFNQTTLDRLHITRWIAGNPDVDGDGDADIDGTQMVYWGVSLGGMLGASLLALEPDFDTSILHVAGGRLLTFATDTEAIAPFKNLIYRRVGSEALFYQLLPVASSLVDAADPATWGAWVLKNRLVGETSPHLLFPVALEDEVVPPSTSRALARALGIPHIEPVASPVSLLPVLSPPVSGTLSDGAVTAGYFQHDRITTDDGVIEPAGHTSTPVSAESLHQVRRFLSDWRSGETPTIVDPYSELGTPPL